MEVGVRHFVTHEKGFEHLGRYDMEVRLNHFVIHEKVTWGGTTWKSE
jgi:hypothetical protein